MASTFAGFSEEDLQRIKFGETGSNSGPQTEALKFKKIEKLGAKSSRGNKLNKPPPLEKHDSNDSIETFFDKVTLSIKSPTSPKTDITDTLNNNESTLKTDTIKINCGDSERPTDEFEEIGDLRSGSFTVVEGGISTEIAPKGRRSSSEIAPDIVRCIENYSEDELAAHKVKLQELQTQQKLMEEQNKKRKEMLAKALADRTKQTVEEQMRLEKIKKELQVLDGQFSQDVAVLRKRIDLACISYADAEKNYLKVEKDFLQAKIQLQKEKERKELLTEHLCTIITQNEARKAKKLDTLMLELADSKTDIKNTKGDKDDDEKPMIVDGVDQKTGERHWIIFLDE